MTGGPDKKIILLSGSGDTVVWFRLDFLNEFLLRSYKVYVLAPDIRDDLKPELINMGIEFIEIKLERKGFNVLNLISSVFELVRLFKEIQPNIIFSYTHKAILSGSLAAKLSGFSNTFSMVTGTGHVFDNQTKKEKLIKLICKVQGKTYKNTKPVKDYKIKISDVKLVAKKVLGIEIMTENIKF